jgi:uncharacterized membrane protein
VTHEPLWILAVLLGCVALSEWLGRRPGLKHLGSALLVIVLGSIASNTGLIPSGSEPVPLYAATFGLVAKASMFLLLLGVRLASLRQAGLPMLGLFVLGAAGTTAGVVVAAPILGMSELLEPMQAELAGMFTATYTGGSLNFNLVAVEYGVAQEGALFAGAVAVDSIATAVWMVITLSLPRLLRRRGGADSQAVITNTTYRGSFEEPEELRPFDLAGLLGLTVATMLVAETMGDVLGVPSVLVLTTVALVLAQVPGVSSLPGTRALGMTGVLLFLAVIGATCDLHALASLGETGPVLFLFVTVALAVHGAVLFGGARLLGLGAVEAAVASQANVGGGTTALALARSLGRGDLILPGILVGSLGTGLGTYLGVIVVEAMG